MTVTSAIYLLLIISLVALAYAAKLVIDDVSTEESSAAEWVGFSSLAVLLSIEVVPLGVSLLLALLPTGIFVLHYIRLRGRVSDDDSLAQRTGGVSETFEVPHDGDPK